MTIIVAKKLTNKIIVAADKQATWGHKKITDSSKIFLHNNSIFGTSGEALVSCLLLAFTKTRVLKNVRDADDVITFLVEFYEWAKKKSSTVNANNNHYIIVTEGKIFCSYGLDTEIVESHCAIGSGMFLALGALECGAAVEKAIEITSKYDLYCSGGIDKIEIEI